jgi:heme o synthase
MVKKKSLESEKYISKSKDYIELCKPRVVMLMILTSFVGMCLATPSFPRLKLLIFANLGIGFSAASAAVINHFADQRIDKLMRRTHNRPIVSGKVSNLGALLLSIALGVSGMAILFCLVNSLTALLTFASMIGYAGIYTFYLKHNTSQNIVIGGLAGATPPLLGWVAVTAHVSVFPIVLVAVIFFWTPPHFWALAIDRIEDYKKTGVPMMPVTHGIQHTKKMMVFYSGVLIFVTILPLVLGVGQWIYLLGTLLLDVWFFVAVWRFYQDPEHRHGFEVFKASIVYLMLYFVVLLLDHYLPFPLH